MVLLEVDHEELVCLQSRHLARLGSEVAAEDKSCAHGPNVRASQVLDIPEPDSNRGRLLQEGILWHERNDTLLAIERDEAARRQCEWLVTHLMPIASNAGG